MDVLVVVDMQKDFVDGALGTTEAVKIVPHVVERVKDGISRGETIVFTRDTHEENYMETQEGRHLPVPHCIRGTEGWEIIPELREYAESRKIVDKPIFGSAELGQVLTEMNAKETIHNITFVGLCTDICVISNALLTKAFLMEAVVTVDAKCCAGVSVETHRNALNAMKVCQITVVNE